jgi:hypothetical protein
VPVSKKRRKPTPKKKRWHRMPRATVSLEPKLEELDTCPGGWVKLRRMSYGELLASNDMAFSVSLEAGDKGSSDPKMGVGASTGRIAEYRFKVCIVDHNLENEAGTRLDFRNAQTMHLLDPNVGQEIDAKISKMHDWQATFPNSEPQSPSGSSATSDQTTTTPELTT